MSIRQFSTIKSFLNQLLKHFVRFARFDHLSKLVQLVETEICRHLR